jgi:putative salt-induced outer membrane protein
MTIRVLLCAIPLLAAAAPAAADPLPDAIRAMITTAAKSDDPAVFASVVAVARQTAPGSSGEIDALAAEISGHPPRGTVIAETPAPPVVAPIPVHVPPTPAPPPAWKGSVELGGSQSSGTTSSLATYGAVDVARVGPTWSHRLSARADYQETAGAATAERVALAYQPQMKIDSSFYGFGLGQFEHDRFLGYEDRYTLGMGLGIKAADRPSLKIAIDAGPAFRHTDFYAYDRENAVAGRASLNIKWLPSQRVTLGEEAAAYVENAQTTAKSVTSLETLLFGPLKARLSYNVQYERDVRAAQNNLDTTTRASLLYSF